jgi:hypothetical protein
MFEELVFNIVETFANTKQVSWVVNARKYPPWNLAQTTIAVEKVQDVEEC